MKSGDAILVIRKDAAQDVRKVDRCPFRARPRAVPMSRVNPRIFREYDIRGVAERDLDDATVRAIGNAIGSRRRRQARSWSGAIRACTRRGCSRR